MYSTVFCSPLPPKRGSECGTQKGRANDEVDKNSSNRDAWATVLVVNMGKFLQDSGIQIHAWAGDCEKESLAVVFGGTVK